MTDWRVKKIADLIMNAIFIDINLLFVEYHDILDGNMDNKYKLVKLGNDFD